MKSSSMGFFITSVDLRFRLTKVQKLYQAKIHGKISHNTRGGLLKMVQ